MPRALSALAFALAASALVAQQPPKDAPAVAEAKKLNGEYTVKAAWLGAQPAPPEVLKEITGVEIKDGTLTIQTGTGGEPATFTLTPPKDPKDPGQIDLTPPKGNARQGLYFFANNELALAVADKGNRPKDFTPTDGVKVLVLTKKGVPMKPELKTEEPKKEPKM